MPMRVSFFGAAGEVTGSCFLLETNKSRVLVDCGMFQGERFSDDANRRSCPFDPARVDAVLATHAHLDHTGRIPKLVNDGFRGTIYTTPPTAELAKIIWEDAIEIMQYDEEKLSHPMLFHADDLARAAEHFHTVQYGNKTEVAPGMVATWHDAGHILGSGFIEIEADGEIIVFSGDLGNRAVPLLRPLEPLPRADVVVMETTYAGHTHEDTKTRLVRLRAAIVRTIGSRGVLLIPAFAIERIQEILYELNGLVEGGRIPRVSMYLDSPLAIRATEIFQKYLNYFNATSMRQIASGDDLFDFPGLIKTSSRDDSRTINDAPRPKVIIAGAGMMTGGRILHHLRRYLPDRTTTLLVVGYQAERTLGRALLNGAERVTIYGDSVQVRAQVEKIGGYSAHADRAGLLQWMVAATVKPKQIFLVHGEPRDQESFAKSLADATGARVILPTLGESFNLA